MDILRRDLFVNIVVFCVGFLLIVSSNMSCLGIIFLIQENMYNVHVIV